MPDTSSENKPNHGNDDELLASLGYKQEFKRAFTPLEVCLYYLSRWPSSLGLIHGKVFGIAFSIIGLLPSIASVLFYSVPNGGGPAMVWGWAVASLFLLAVGLSMGEMASAAPTSGGMYFWTYTLAPTKWKRLLCWVVGYANTIGSISAVASINWACAVQIMAAAAIGSGGEFQATSAQLFGCYVMIMIAHIFICCVGTAVFARLQTIYVFFNIVYADNPFGFCLVVLIALPAVTPSNLKNTAKFALWDFTNRSFDASVHISEEAGNAAIAVPWAITLAIGIGGVVGWAINVSVAFCMGTDLEAIYNDPQPMAHIFQQSFGQKGTLAIWFMMGSSMLLSASRQTFAFSRDGALPLSSWLYRMNSVTKTPVNPVVFDGIMAILLGLFAFAGSQAINAVFAMSVVGNYIAYSIPIAARFLNKTDPFKPGVIGQMQSKPIGVTAVIFMSVMSVVFFFPNTPNTDAPNMNYTVVVLGGIIGLSIVWFYFPKYGGVHWFTGPLRTLEKMDSTLKDNTDSRGNSSEIVEKKDVADVVEVATAA
ncbi:hypothetical protein H0H92_014584 [Tricholoma furcatifolium]|nr:hypothetical protein H0H92_014584 [Tricholoma furcatifolium]